MPTDILPKNEGARAETPLPFRFDEKRHAYFLGDSPLCGTTTILSILDKSGLTYWASGMACEVFGWRNSKKEGFTACLDAAQAGLDMIRNLNITEYLALLDKAYRAHATKKDEAKDKGVDMHAMLEEYVKAHMAGNELLIINPLIQPFVDWAAKNVKRFLFSELCTYSSILHCGGTADFGYEDLNGNYVLGDFKSSSAVYYSMAVQLGAYDLQIKESGGFTPEGKKIFTLDKPFNHYAIFAARRGLDKPFYFHDTQRLRKAFSYCAHLYQERLFLEDYIAGGKK